MIVKTPSVQNKERILKAIRKNCQLIYKGKSIRITEDFSEKTLKVKKAWGGVFKLFKF
jgi:hypothetical protein